MAKQHLATLSGRTLVMPANTMYRIRKPQATFDCQAKASLGDGDTFSVTDEAGISVTFEYDVTGTNTPSAGNIEIDISSVSTASEVAEYTAVAIAEARDLDGAASGVGFPEDPQASRPDGFPVAFTAKVSGSTVTVISLSSGDATSATVTNGTGSPLTSITDFSSDTSPLPVEEINSKDWDMEDEEPTIAAVAPTGSGLTGDYYYIFVFYDACSNTESQKSLAVKVTLDAEAADITLNAGTPTARSRHTHVRIYRSIAQASNETPSVFFLLDQVAEQRVHSSLGGLNSYIDEQSDTALSNFILDGEFVEPPDMDFVVEHNGRLWGANAINPDTGVKDNNVYISLSEDPDHWSPLNVFPIGESTGPITALRGQGPDMIVFKQDEVHVFDYNHRPFADARIDVAFRSRGALNQKCVVDADGQLFAMDSSGIYMYESLVNLVNLGDPVSEILCRRNMGERSNFHGIFSDGKLRFFFAVDDETTINRSLVLDVDKLRRTGDANWWLEFYDHDIVDSSLFDFGSDSGLDVMDNRRVGVVMDSLANSYVLDYLHSDGVPSSLAPDATVSATDSSSPHITITARDDGRGFDSAASAYDALGIFVRFLDSDGTVSDAHQITGITSNTEIDISPAPTANQYDGQTILIGSIHAIYDSNEESFGNAFLRKKIARMKMSISPSPFETPTNVFLRRDKRAGDYMSETADDGLFSTTQGVEGHVVRMGGDLTQSGRGITKVPASSQSFHYLSYSLQSRLTNRPWVLNVVDLELAEEGHNNPP